MENTRIGPFRILKKLGSHRRHQVYKAIEVERGRKVAVKFVPRPRFSDQAAVLSRLKHEVKILGHLEHPNLVTTYGVYDIDDHLFYVSELIEGENLISLLSRRGRMATEMVVDFGHQIAQLLEYLHSEELVHAKLMTENFMVTLDGQIKMIDLRLNRPHKRRWDAPPRPPMDAVAYMSPEQLETRKPTYKSDLYSLGIVFYELLTGNLPFEPQNFSALKRIKRELRPPSVTKEVLACPGWLDELVASLMQPDPNKRPHSVTAVRLTLEQIHQVEITKKTAAEEFSKGFTALAAGKDKKEARKLLGIKKSPAEQETPRSPLLESFGFLIAGLLFVGIVIGVISMLPSHDWEGDLQRAERLLQSDQREDWQEARQLADPIRSGSSYPLEQKLLATEIYFEARTKSLLRTAEVGLIGLERKEIRLFCDAYRFQKDGKLDQAMMEYKNLIDTVDPEGDQRYIHEQARLRYEQLSIQKDQAKEWMGAAWLSYDEAIETIESGKEDEGIAQLQALVERYGDNGFMMEFNSRVAAKLKQLQPPPPAPEEVPTQDPPQSTQAASSSAPTLSPPETLLPETATSTGASTSTSASTSPSASTSTPPID